MAEQATTTGHTMTVRLIAVHVRCSRCGDTQRLEHDRDAFTGQVLLPLASWWVAHLAPALTMVELEVNGRHQECQAVSVGGVD